MGVNYTIVAGGRGYWIIASDKEGSRSIERFDSEDMAVRRLHELKAKSGIEFTSAGSHQVHCGPATNANAAAAPDCAQREPPMPPTGAATPPSHTVILSTARGINSNYTPLISIQTFCRHAGLLCSYTCLRPAPPIKARPPYSSSKQQSLRS